MRGSSPALPQPWEHWRPVPGFPGYEVSEFGRLRTYRVRGTGPGQMGEAPRQRKMCHGSTGYPIVVVKDAEGRYRSMAMHTLVALAFLGPKPNGAQVVRHLNGDKCDNVWTNLAYGTAQENSDDMFRLGERRTGSRLPQSKLTESDVAAIHQRLRRGERYAPIAADYGVSHAAIRNIYKGKAWTHVLCAV